MSDYVELMGVDELPDGEMTSFQVDGSRLLVARVGEQHFVADALCPHLRGRLDKGTLDGTVVTCPRHGSRFDLADGRCLRWTKFTGAVKGAVELVRHERPLTVYETLVEDGKLFVGPAKPVASESP